MNKIEEEIERISGDENFSTDIIRESEEEREEKINILLGSRKDEIDKKVNRIAEIVVESNALIEQAVVDILNGEHSVEKSDQYKIEYAKLSLEAITLRSNEIIGFDMDDFVKTTWTKFDIFVDKSLKEIKKLTLENLNNEKTKEKNTKGKGRNQSISFG